MGLIWLTVTAFAGIEVGVYSPGLLDVSTPHGLTWTDESGENLVSWEVRTQPCASSAAGCEHTQLRIEHHVRQKGSVFRMHELTQEFECSDDGGLRFWKPSLDDVDGDGTAEVSFATEMGCITDMSPLSLEVTLWEGADSYTLEGETPAWEGTSGLPTLGAKLLKSPVFKAHVLARYEEVREAIRESRAWVLLPSDLTPLATPLQKRQVMELSELVRASRPELVETFPISTRALRGADDTNRVVSLSPQQTRQTQCRDERCLEALRFGAHHELVSDRVLKEVPEGNLRSAFLLPQASTGFVSGYVGSSSTGPGAANSTNLLTCFVADRMSGERLTVGDFFPDRDEIASLETERRSQHKSLGEDPLSGYALHPQAIRVHTTNGVSTLSLCAVSTTDITEGTVVEIPVATFVR